MDLKNNNCNKTVLYQNEYVEMEICYSVLITSLEEFMKLHNVKADSELLSYLSDQFESHQYTVFQDTSNWWNPRREQIQGKSGFLEAWKTLIEEHRIIFGYSPELLDRFSFRLADILESGQIAIYDKTKHKYLKSIIFEEYRWSGAPLMGAGGRRFKTEEGVLFFETLDWVS